MKSTPFDGKALHDHDFQSMVDLLAYLTSKGYTLEFTATENGMLEEGSNKLYSVEDVHITGSYRFEGESDPADSVEIFAVETSNGLRGTIILAFGAKHNQNEAIILRLEFQQD